MKIAFITYEMIPYSNYWGASQRVYYFAQELKSAGHDVIVISKKNRPKEDYYDRCVDFKTYHLGYNDVIQNQTKPKSSNFLKIKKLASNINKWIDKHINNDPNIGMGNISRMWITRHKKEILKILKEHSSEHVIISAPPFGLLQNSIIKEIKKLASKLTIDYRDPWNCWNDRQGVAWNRENHVLKLCDNVIVTNHNHKDRLALDFPFVKDKICVIENGYDEIIWSEIEKRDTIVSRNAPSNDKMIISYIGAISFESGSYRDPSTLIEAVKLSKLESKIMLRFVGVNLHDNNITNIRNKYPYVELLSQVSQNESLIHMLESDVLVNIHITNNKSSHYLVAAKVYDYLRSGKYILSINNPESYECKLINKTSSGTCISNEVHVISSELLRLYELWCNGNLMSTTHNCVVDYSRTKQAKLLTNIL